MVGMSGWLCLLPLIHGDDIEPLKESIISHTVFFGFIWAGVLFTGFFQLGSRGSLSTVILSKLGATFFGGAVSILATVGFVRGNWPRPVYYIGHGLALLSFSFALYEAISYV
jgi:hypothetical protein